MDNINEKIELITSYRDKMLIEREKILNDYARLTEEKGMMYFVYSENSQKENFYNLCVIGKNLNHEIIEVNKNEISEEVEINSVLRKVQNKYILDKDTTQKVQMEISNLYQKILKEQEDEMQKNRIEGNLYEFVERTENTLWLINSTKNDGECFEETKFPLEILDKLKEGSQILYQNGKYQLYN